MDYFERYQDTTQGDPLYFVRVGVAAAAALLKSHFVPHRSREISPLLTTESHGENVLGGCVYFYFYFFLRKRNTKLMEYWGKYFMGNNSLTGAHHCPVCIPCCSSMWSTVFREHCLVQRGFRAGTCKLGHAYQKPLTINYFSGNGEAWRPAWPNAYAAIYPSAFRVRIFAGLIVKLTRLHFDLWAVLLATPRVRFW